MTTDAGSDGWYWDERTTSHSPGYVWTYGIEVWCNMEGQYVHIVADLSHLTPPYTMSLCSVGIMGTSYTRDEPLPYFFELYQGQSKSISVPHIFDEFTSVRDNIIHLRQAQLLELPFVTIIEETGNSIVHINSEGIEIGDYQLQLESFDTLSSIQPTLKTDIIYISVKEPYLVEEEPQLVEALESQFISAVEPSSWVLELNSVTESRIQLEVSPNLARFITFDELTQTISFHGNESSGFLSGKF